MVGIVEFEFFEKYFSLDLGTTKHAIQGFFLNLARELRIDEHYQNRVTTTVAMLGLIATEEALKKTNKHLHILAADVCKTAEAVIAAGCYGQTRLFYPYVYGVIPPLYQMFSSVFEFFGRVSS